MEHTVALAQQLVLPFIGGVLLCALASGLIMVARYALKRASESESWPSVEGYVVESDVAAVREGRRQVYRPVVRYRYEVGGARFEGSRIRSGELVEFRKFTRARIMLDKYRAGKAVAVHYDPNRPGVAVLQTGYDIGLRPAAVIAPVAAVYMLFYVGYALIGI
jgi:hypothetical protein